MQIESYGEALAYDAAFWMAGLRDPETALEELGELSQQVSKRLRALAIITLLVKARNDLFAHNLIRSGRVRLQYLERLAAAGIEDDHHQASGRSRGFVDALAAGDIELCRKIAAVSRAELHTGHEYEDDYSFAQILHRLVRRVAGDRPAIEAEIGSLLERWKEYRSDDPRIGVVRALSTRDATAFDEAFDELLLARNEEIAAAKARGELEDPIVVAERNVYVEGLALLRLADLAGIPTEDEYRLCPSLARVPLASRPPEDE